MKKRIGTKIYDTEKGIPVIPELCLYKQPNKRTFYIFDGEKITPLDFTEAEKMVVGAGRDDLLSMFGVKADSRGVVRFAIKQTSYDKLAEYSRKTGRSMKSIIEAYIDSLSIDE